MRYVFILMLTVLWGQAVEPTLDADHQFIYADQGVYYLMNAEPVVLPGVPQGVTVSWTPDGHYLTYFRDSVYSVMDVDTGKVIYTFESDVATPLWKPIWSNDGRHFVVENVESAGDSDAVESLVLFTVDASYRVIGSQRIYEGSTLFPVWSPDGTRLAFVDQFVPADSPSVLHIYDVETMTLTDHPIDTLPTFSVYWWGDEHIAFVSAAGIYLINLNTDVAQLIYQTDTTLPSTNAWGFSPDHTRLMFNLGLYASTENGFERIHDVEASTAWSPDSQYFLATVVHNRPACYPNRIRLVCYAGVTLDIVLNDRDGNRIAEIAEDVSVVDFGWRP